MSLVQLLVPTEVAHDAVYELGHLGDVQFKDVVLFASDSGITYSYTLQLVKSGSESVSTLFRWRNTAH